ncbi:hypothetical protein [Patulibacter defluvii]|uniref:hypothetical protein n=1 Tax=Patulibacter defluvii TaxID=3095358 RepID=UPI002A750820|nr:hypothetical protein [Patulibacter sp. DM4]
MRPEDALDAARRLAAEHATTTIPGDGLRVERSSQPSDDQLLQWAVVEPDLREVRSTRRLGAPVTRTKQALLRLLGQYHAQVLSVQNRVNVHLALRSSLVRDELRELRSEVDGLRRRLREVEGQLGVERSAADVRADERSAVRQAEEEATARRQQQALRAQHGLPPQDDAAREGAR